MEDKFGAFIKDEFLKEAAEIEAEVLADKSVSAIKPSEEIRVKIMKEIRKASPNS